ncbi:choice-of-anchor B family protein [Gracilimonas tropica]|uniref:choice-of-anchor B family protein n=1 Tax=Gracilimonas tropica TaxID=454600 RepID=UPI00039C8FF2|nr:choice-of-anchor B family protein [Gracilimonas tropica]
MFQKFTLLGTLLLLGGLFSSCDLSNADDKLKAPFPCEDGNANGFACENVDLFAQLSIYELSGDSTGVYLNDIWGWTDPQTSKEYALVGLTNGTAFVDISDPETPVVVGRLPESNLRGKFKQLTLNQYPACNLGIGTTNRSKSISMGTAWRDIKVYDNHAFIVSDAQPHGMQVFDLTNLRDFDGQVLQFEHDALYDKFGPAHNIVINEQTGFAYGVGITQSEMCGSRDSTGLHMIDISNPKSPEFAGCYIDPSPGYYRIAPGYIHDAQCVVYNGPDSEHSGQEICFNSAEGNVVIADVSDKENPKTIGFNRQADMQYSHQGWLTEDQAFFLMNDELDERNLGRGTKTYIWDVRDLEDPRFVGYYEHESLSIDHNLYVRGKYAYETNYNAGLQILDISDVEDANLERVAYFDTQPQTDAAVFTGTWSNYPYFSSGMVVLSDIETGLFIVRPNL